MKILNVSLNSIRNKNIQKQSVNNALKLEYKQDSFSFGKKLSPEKMVEKIIEKRNTEVFNMCSAGFSADEVAMFYGITPFEVMQIVRDITEKQYANFLKEDEIYTTKLAQYVQKAIEYRAIELYKSGKPIKEISKELKMSVSKINECISKQEDKKQLLLIRSQNMHKKP